ncbi:helix-turn-helix domain-containing protein [Listeria ilorinensis]|uniref:helix-turn-helix domain-containing protein n=1 Tax=Listeria ilorinensis TaxID=2867439 RepID=UPI001EF6E925|nr:Rgg/GadR/MutR family transcriptional regulator [Listeria ilorinensis]
MRNRRQIGELIKEIRENSGVHSQKLYEGLMTRTNLYRIESNQQGSSYETVIQLVERLSMSVGEFEYIRRDYHDDPLKEFMDELRKIRVSIHTKDLKELQLQIEQQIENEYSDVLVDLYHMISGYIILQETNDLSLARTKFLKIWSRLEKKDCLYYNDVLLLSNILFMFEEDIMLLILERLNRYYQIYDNFGETKRIKRNTLYNYCTYLRLQERYLEAEKVIKNVYQLATEEKDVLMILESQYCLCEVAWIKGDKTKSHGKVRKIIEALKISQQEFIAADIQEDWYKLTGKQME